MTLSKKMEKTRVSNSKENKGKKGAGGIRCELESFHYLGNEGEFGRPSRGGEDDGR